MRVSTALFLTIASSHCWRLVSRRIARFTREKDSGIGLMPGAPNAQASATALIAEEGDGVDG
jgi:hypothetical protein